MSKFGFFGDKSSKDDRTSEPRSVIREDDVDSFGPDRIDPYNRPTTTDSRIRQHFGQEVEEDLNKHINLRLQAAYVYKSMASHFRCNEVALRGFSKYLLCNSLEGNVHAWRFMKYVTKRGGTVTLQDIVKPATDNWGTGLSSILTVLEMEKSINEHLIRLHQLSVKRMDPHMEEFIKKFLCIQVNIIKELGDHVTNLKRVGTGLGEYLFDKKTLKKIVKKKIVKRTLRKSLKKKGLKKILKGKVVTSSESSSGSESDTY